MRTSPSLNRTEYPILLPLLDPKYSDNGIFLFFLFFFERGEGGSGRGGSDFVFNVECLYFASQSREGSHTQPINFIFIYLA